MGADVGGDGQAAAVGVGQHFQGAGAGEAAQVDPGAGLLGQGQVAGQGDGLGGLGDAGQAEAGGDAPLVGAALGAQLGVLGAQEDGEPEGGGVFQGAAQHLGIEDGAVGLAHDGAAGLAQGDHLAELLPRQALGEGAGGDDPRPAGPVGGAGDELGHRRGVDDGPGVRGAAEAGDARRRRRRRLAGDGALVLLARLPQAGAEVDEAWADDLAPGVQDLVRLEARRGRAHRHHPPLGQVQVQEAIDAVGRVDEAAVADAEAGEFQSWAVDRRAVVLGAEAQGHDRHAHGDAVADLFQDHRARAVGDLGVHLHPAIDGPGVHDDGVGLGGGQTLLGEAEELEVFVLARQQGAAHPLPLQAQHDDHIHVPHPLAQVVADPDAEGLGIGGEQGARGDQAHLGDAQRLEGRQLRARHPRVEDVADDGHPQGGEVALVAADGEHVQQALGGVGVAAVAGVDDADPGGGVLGDEVGGAALGVADHEHVHVHGLQVAQGVEQGLALGGGGGGDVEGQHVRREPLGRQLEGGAGAGAGLEEEIGHRLAPAQRHLLDRLAGHAQEALALVEDPDQQGAGQALQGQTVAEVALGVELEVGQGGAGGSRAGLGAPAQDQGQGRGAGELDLEGVVAGQAGLEVEAGGVGGDGQFPTAAPRQHRQQDRGGAAVGEEAIQGGADGAPGVEDIVHQDEMAVVDGDRQVRGPHLGVQAQAAEVVPVVGDVQHPQGLGEAQGLVQALGDPDAAGMDADHEGIQDAALGELGLEDGAHARQGGLDVGGGGDDLSGLHSARSPAAVSRPWRPPPPGRWPCARGCWRASRVVRRSSTRYTGRPKRPSIWRAKRRARGAISVSVSSMLKGRPTTAASGCHSRIRASMRGQSGRSSRQRRVVRGAAVAVTCWPTATPILRGP